MPRHDIARWEELPQLLDHVFAARTSFEVIARSIYKPSPNGFLARATLPPSGETLTSVLAKAAIRGETDPLLGKGARAFMGKRVGRD